MSDLLIMSRHKQKDEKKTAESESQIVDKKINELYSEIRESRSKLDNYVSKLNDQIGYIISHRLNKFVSLHSQIVEEKDHEIKLLEESNEKARLSQIGQNVQKLMKTIKSYQLEIERINSIKEMFRKESQKFKIQLDIKQKELDACKKREKVLIKKVWILEEDIKDIYSSQMPIGPEKARTGMQIFCTPKKRETQLKRKNIHPQHKIHTEPTQMENRQKLQWQLQQKYSGKKIQMFNASRPTQKLSLSDQKRVNPPNNQRGSSVTGNYSRHQSLTKQAMRKEIDIYQDLRTNLRKASRIKQTQPQYWSDKEKPIQREDFRSICLYGHKIMKQIQKIFIDSYGELRQIDESSISLLQELFKNQNALKILEIVLFNHSLAAINHIRDNRQAIINEQSYDQPEIESYEIMNRSEFRPKRIKMEKQLRKKFTNCINKAQDLYSQRVLNQ